MSADAVVPHEIKQLAQELVAQQAGVLAIAYAELAKLLEPARNVRVMPAQRFAAESIDLTAAQLPRYRIVGGGRWDIRKVTVTYHGSTATGPDVVRLGSSLGVVSAATASACIRLNTNRRQAELWVNAAELWIGRGADAGASESLDVLVEEYDPT